MNSRRDGVLPDRTEDKFGPKISVIIPVHNGGKYLDEALSSVLAQEVAVLDVIVIDDGSTDQSAEVAKRHAARNQGVRLATGTFLSFLDADDRWVTNKLKIQIAAFAQDPTLEMVYGHVRQLHDGEAWDRGISAHTHDASQLIAGMLAGTILVRRESFLRVGLLRTDYRVGEFVDWCMRAVDLGCRSKMLPDLLLWRRIHDSNLGIREQKHVNDYA